MKTLSIITLLLFFSLTVNAQNKQTKTVYAFCYAYNYDTKILYVSDIVNGIVGSDTYFDASNTSLDLQWNAKFKTVVEKYFNYNRNVTGFPPFSDDYETVDGERTRIIGKYKQEGFAIHHINSFSYTNEKR
ncbi:hypothetical protein [Moheibacter sediminis]|uniref:Uncharacterized protein n=1 Tax=Moheibacter sediminis TaxID=1434700 RepID=A0A1W1Y9W4_9FLAO|nr:hypothetical protein [Moheibacter sediminis]SMC32936.1 hypothetical protein SAMN06296427_101156 [Moheibacter sediminis]